MVDLAGLRGVPGERARLDAAELELIDRARRDGATWAEIAEALGLSSRQAAEQRRLRLATASLRPEEDLDEAYGARIAAVRAAAVEVHRRIGADRRWAGRFTRAALVRDTLAAAVEAPAGPLFALVEQALADLAPPDPAAGGAGGSGRPLPGPMRAAVARLSAALRNAQP